MGFEQEQIDYMVGLKLEDAERSVQELMSQPAIISVAGEISDELSKKAKAWGGRIVRRTPEEVIR